MRFLAAVMLVSLAASAQDAPADVDQALRARVTEFFGYHVSGEFENAWPMVADDTKKEYFAAQKTKYESFHIDSIKYSDNFTKAVVTLTVTENKRLSAQMPVVTLTHPTSVLWKIENGKWCWYNDHTSNWLMPMGPSDPKSLAAARTGKPGDMVITPGKMNERVMQIMGQSTLSKPDLRLSPAKESSDQVVFHNGQGGSVKVGLMPVDLPPGMTATLDKSDLGANEEAVLKVTYSPKKDSVPSADITLNIVMEPFARKFPITVHFVQN